MFFILDKKKIYYKKDKDTYEIAFYENDGPIICINNIICLSVTGNPINETQLRIIEADFENYFEIIHYQKMNNIKEFMLKIMKYSYNILISFNVCY